MKVLIVSQYWRPENGVPQRRWTWLTDILLQEGHEVTVIAPPPHYDRKIGFRDWYRKCTRTTELENRITDGPVRVLRSGFIPTGNSVAAKAINQIVVAFSSIDLILRRPNELKDYDVDLIIGTVPAIPTAGVVWIASVALKAPFVIDLRDAWPDLFTASDSWNRGAGGKDWAEFSVFRGFRRIIEGCASRGLDFLISRADGLIFTSERLEESVINDLSLWKDRIIPPTLTVRNVFPVETDFEKSAHIGDLVDSRRSELRVLYAGTLGRAQNLHNAIKAAKIAQQLGVKIRLKFVGAGAQRSALLKSARELGVDAEFEPRRRANELREHYEWADTALVHLTDWEPLARTVPSKLYELMESKIHITAVASGETAEIVSRFKAGVVVEPEDPLKLASKWVELFRTPELLYVDGQGADWVKSMRQFVVPTELTDFIEDIRFGRR